MNIYWGAYYPNANTTYILGLDHSSPGMPLSSRSLIVLHITTGPSDFGQDKEPAAMSAINTFMASEEPHRVSSHFVIDRDGTIYQLVDCDRSAWHASAVNGHSVGIEVSASADGKYPATEEQYTALSTLVVWLLGQMHREANGATIMSHNAASPIDGHVKCCTGGLDPGRVLQMVQEGMK